MRIVSYTEARNSLKSVLDGVEADADIAIITRRDGADAVVMSLAQYQSMAETLHLLSSPANAAHLAESIAQYRAGQARRRALVPE
jgi:antitoxin YefM